MEKKNENPEKAMKVGRVGKKSFVARDWLLVNELS
jgi:hypothetical protein